MKLKTKFNKKLMLNDEIKKIQMHESRWPSSPKP